jgi:hypothetical protein
MLKAGVNKKSNGCSQSGGFVLKSDCALAQVAIVAATIEK